ncbi:MAG: TonB-dependent receptor, partial [Bacteroidales bacterium]|nr:TonB-dependent receptor [Bacteroidales bacterium]
AVAGYSYYDYMSENLHTYNYDFPTDQFEYNNMGLGLALKDGNATMSSGRSMNKLISFFSRVNYSYDEKYILALSLREDGSSKFGPKNRWGTFWSASAAWRLSQEDFLKDLNWMDELKLKVSYGVTGVEPSSAYLSKQTYSYGNPTYMDGKWIYTISPSRVANPNLKWEEKHELNIGVDFSVLNRRLSGSLDLYSRVTKDLLYTYNVPVPPNLASTIYANVGSIANKGIELQLNGQVLKTSDWTLNISGNVSYNSNLIKSLSNEFYTRDYMEVGSTGSPVQKTTHIVKENGAVGDFYGWESIALKKNGAWKVIKEDGSDGTYGDEGSRHVIGNGIPKIFAGLAINAAWRQFDLSVNLRGAFCYQILNQYRMLWETFQKGQQYNYPKTILERPYGGEYYLGINTSPSYVSYFLENGDFVKIDNISLGYNFKLRPESIVKTLRVYASAMNFFTFTGYKGIDPEVNFGGLSPGIESENRYPTTKNVSLGVKVGF